MRAVVQRVREASVVVEDQVVGAIGRGFLVLLGVTHADSDAEAAALARKIAGLRIFEDTAGKFNLALSDVDGAALVVSQFTLYGDARKGRRPSFIDAARPERAKLLFERFVAALRNEGVAVQTGVFGATMAVHLVNDGPVTLWLDTAEWDPARRPMLGDRSLAAEMLAPQEATMDQEQIETTLAIAQAMADELTDYLMGDNLYRQLIVKTPSGVKQPKMTIGALLENVQRLEWEQAQLSPEQRGRLQDIKDRIAIGRGALGARWRTLLRRELKALLDSWRWYLQDASLDPDARENYGREAHIRTRIDLIVEALAKDPLTHELRRELNELDERLRAMLQGTSYVGPRGYERHYPADRAWWLYGQPVGQE